MNNILRFNDFKLILEAKVEDIYEMYYKNKIEEEVFYLLLDADPTTVKKNGEYKKKGNYIDWLIKTYLKVFSEKSKTLINRFLKEDLSFVTSDLEFFDKNKSKFDIKNRDINNFKSFQELYKFIFDMNKNEESLMSNKEKEESIKKDTVKLLDNEEHLLLIPKTEEASCYYGKNTRWCTAAINNNQFDDYVDDGDLLIFIDKKDNRKYQFHFNSDQFMDEQDDYVDFHELIKDKTDVIETLKDYIVNDILTKGSYDLSVYFGMINFHEYNQKDIERIKLLKNKEQYLTYNELRIDFIIYLHKNNVIDDDSFVDNTDLYTENNKYYLTFDGFFDHRFLSIFDHENEELARQIFMNEYINPNIIEVEECIDLISYDNNKKIENVLLKEFKGEYALDHNGDKILINDSNYEEVDLSLSIKVGYLDEIEKTIINSAHVVDEKNQYDEIYKTFTNKICEILGLDEFTYKKAKLYNKDYLLIEIKYKNLHDLISAYINTFDFDAYNRGDYIQTRTITIISNFLHTVGDLIYFDTSSITKSIDRKEFNNELSKMLLNI